MTAEEAELLPRLPFAFTGLFAVYCAVGRLFITAVAFIVEIGVVF